MILCRWVVPFIAVLAAGCAPQGAPTLPSSPIVPVFPAGSWLGASARDVGLDSALLDAAVQQIVSGRIRDISSMVVVRHGYVVLERYFNGSSRDDVHTMQSVSKSITSLVAGAAIARGTLATGTPVLTALGAPYDALAIQEPRRSAITVEHLLTMRSGINFHESPYPGSPLERLNGSRGDWTALALGEPMNAEPGSRWQYNSGGVIALASVIRKSTAQSFQEFAQAQLFGPVGITSAWWSASPFDGLAHAGGGLHLRALDLARLGYLVLRRGEWAGTQVLPASWIDQSVAAISSRVVTYGGQSLDYGYLWYSWPLGGVQRAERWNNIVIAAAGNMTQWLFVVPRHDLVVVFTGIGNASFPEPIRLVREAILQPLDATSN